MLLARINVTAYQNHVRLFYTAEATIAIVAREHATDLEKDKKRIKRTIRNDVKVKKID